MIRLVGVVLPLAGLVALLAVGCSKQTPGPGDATPPAIASTVTPPAASVPVMATMTLIDAGQAPRRKLRYVWRPGRKETLTLDLLTSTTTSTGVPGEEPTDIPLPPVHIVLAIDPQHVAPDGALLFAWHVTSATVKNTEETPSQVADGMRAEVAAIDHLSGTAEVTSRGLAKTIEIDPASVTDGGATGQMVEQVRQILRDLAAPFPEEDVGPGARWEKLSQLATKDVRITQTDTFSLLDVAGDNGTLDDILAQVAPAQSLAGAGAQPRLESMLASGDAKTHFSLSRLAPDTKFDGTTTMVVSGSPTADRSRKLTMVMHVEIVLAGVVR